MQTIKEHIAFRIITITIVIAIITPSIVKFSHIFTHHQHKHEICKGERTTHLHELDLDCEFYKFQLNKNYASLLKYDNFFCKLPHYKAPILTYKFLNNHQPLSFSLRGPPSLV